MKPSQLPTKRQPVSRGVFRRLYAITTRKQRVAATASASELEGNDVPNLGVGRALLVIFILHVLAIGGVLFHKYVLDGRQKQAPEEIASRSVAVPAATEGSLPKLATGEAAYLVQAGDSYQSIAQIQNLDEQELRAANNNVPARAGRVFRLPPKKIVAVDPPEMAALRQEGKDIPAIPEVPEVAVTNIPKAVVVHPAKSAQSAVPAKSNQTSAAPKSNQLVSMTKAPAPAAASASGHTCMVAQGDSIWRIASRNKVTPAALMKANGISDPRKIRPGMKLVLPANH